MNIYLTFEREKKLRDYAERNGKNLSTFVGEGIDALDGTAFIEESKQILQDELSQKPMCDRPFCKQRSEGTYRVTTNEGTEAWIWNMCIYHWNQARKEGEVSAI